MRQVMQLQHVIEDEKEGDDPGRPLQYIADIAGVRVAAGVRHGPADDEPADGSMKQQGDKDERPLDQGQYGPQRVDSIDLRLKRSRAVEDRRIGQQVDDQVPADRQNAGQRKQAVDQELVARDEGRGPRRAGTTRRSFHNDLPVAGRKRSGAGGRVAFKGSRKVPSIELRWRLTSGPWRREKTRRQPTSVRSQTSVFEPQRCGLTILIFRTNSLTVPALSPEQVAAAI